MQNWLDWFSELPEELRQQMTAATAVVIFYVIWFAKFYVYSLVFGIEKIQHWFKVVIRYEDGSFVISNCVNWLKTIGVYFLIFLWLLFATLAPGALAYASLVLFFGV